MKTNTTIINRIAALCTIVGALVALPTAGHAQIVATNGEYGIRQTATAPQQVMVICSADAEVIDGAPNGDIYVDTAQGSISGVFAAMDCIRSSKGVTYAMGTAYGYWYAAGSSAPLACQVEVMFTQLANGQGSMRVYVSSYSDAVYNGVQYAAGQTVYSSGNVSLLTPNGLGIEMGE